MTAGLVTGDLRAWGLLAASGLADVAWAYAMKRSNGLTEPFWTVLSLVLLATLVVLLGKALQTLPLGAAYGVWTGIGAVGAMSVGVVWLGEGFSLLRLAFLVCVVIGIAGLKATA